MSEQFIDIIVPVFQMKINSLKKGVFLCRLRFVWGGGGGGGGGGG